MSSTGGDSDLVPSSYRPPQVTVHSPVTTPVEATTSEHESPGDMSSSTPDATSPLPNDRFQKVRDSALIRSNSFSHDKELSDALRWNQAETVGSLTTSHYSGEPSEEGSEKPQTQTTDEWSMLDRTGMQETVEDEYSFPEGDDSKPLEGSLVTKSKDDDANESSGASLATPAPTILARKRERRRVNISGRMGMAMQMEPIHEDEAPQTNRSRSHTLNESKISHPPTPTRTRSSSDSEETRPISRKVSAPDLTTRDKLQDYTALRFNKSKASNANSTSPFLTFPLSKGPLRRTPLPQASALTAILSSASKSSGPINPFTSLYGALALRTQDALKLTVFFPTSKASYLPPVCNGL